MCHRYFTFKSGFAQGFDVFDISAVPPGMTDTDRRSTSKQLTDVAIEMLSKPANTGAGKPFFAWFHYFDPHLPYVPHEGAPDFGRSDRSQSGQARAQYDEEVWFTDLHLGRLLDFVKAQPWGANTAIILTADHGEAFGEHKHWGHGRELWEPLVRVPLIVAVPGAAPRRVSLPPIAHRFSCPPWSSCSEHPPDRRRFAERASSPTPSRGLTSRSPSTTSTSTCPKAPSTR